MIPALALHGTIVFHELGHATPDEAKLVGGQEEAGALVDPPSRALDARGRRAEGHAVLLAQLQDVLGGPDHAWMVVLAGVAILASFQDALEKAFGGHLRFGALTAFAVAATPFSILGITSAFWAILAGVAGSLLAERKELFDYWRDPGQQV